MNRWFAQSSSRVVRLSRRLARKKLPIRPYADFELLEAVASSFPGVDFEDLSHEVLLGIQRERGVDFATALFYDRARKSPPPTSAPLEARTVLVVPSALYTHYPEFAGDGQIFESLARAQGLPARLAPVVSVGSTTENAAIIRDELLREEDGSVLMATLSKGAADFRRALDLYPDIHRKIAAWLCVSGVAHGTYVCNRMLEARGLKKLMITLNLWLHDGSWEFARTLFAGPGSVLSPRLSAADYPFPIASVFGCPLRHHLSAYTRARHSYVSKQGPNDGCGLLADVFIPGSRLFPIWGADHFLFTPQASFALYEAFEALLGRTRPTRPTNPPMFLNT